MFQDIILASHSARRKQLLELAEIPFEVITRGTDESYPSNLSPEDIPVYIAEKKAMSVREKLQTAYHGQYKNQPVLAADTIVLLDDTIIGKPKNAAHAMEILRMLSGRTHKVVTGVVILKGEQKVSLSDISEVEFHELSDDIIQHYVTKYCPFDKAGAYGIQEWIGVIGIKSIRGDYYNVMGLPISRVIKALKALNCTK